MVTYISHKESLIFQGNYQIANFKNALCNHKGPIISIISILSYFDIECKEFMSEKNSIKRENPGI